MGQKEIEIARRISKTRRTQSLTDLSGNSTIKRRQSSDSIMYVRRKMSDAFSDQIMAENLATDKIREWLTNNNDGDNFDRQRSRSRNSSGIFETISEIDDENEKVVKGQSDPDVIFENDLKERKLSNDLKEVVMETDCKLESVDWNESECDVLLKVDDTLFPVNKSILTSESKYFKALFGKQNEKYKIMTLHGHEYKAVRSVLKYIYSVGEEPITDENVASFLQLGDVFSVRRLCLECEQHLQTSVTFNPFITLHLARQYGFDNLVDHSLKEISKLENIENTSEFDSLDAQTQNQIYRYILQRYQKATQTLSQFDVHLCSYHGNDPKNNTCCFRAATYSTENERTFLVKMENPETKLISNFEKAFNIDSIRLDSGWA